MRTCHEKKPTAARRAVIMKRILRGRVDVEEGRAMVDEALPGIEGCWVSVLLGARSEVTRVGSVYWRRKTRRSASFW